MIQISFQLFVILISTDVLRQTRRGVAENFEKKFIDSQKAVELPS